MCYSDPFWVFFSNKENNKTHRILKKTWSSMVSTEPTAWLQWLETAGALLAEEMWKNVCVLSGRQLSEGCWSRRLCFHPGPAHHTSQWTVRTFAREQPRGHGSLINISHLRVFVFVFFTHPPPLKTRWEKHSAPRLLPGKSNTSKISIGSLIQPELKYENKYENAFMGNKRTWRTHTLVKAVFSVVWIIFLFNFF